MDVLIQQRIDAIYQDLKPLQEYYGIKSRTIEERYRDYLQKQQVQAAMAAVPKPRFKLPKL